MSAAIPSGADAEIAELKDDFDSDFSEDESGSCEIAIITTAIIAITCN